MSTPRKNSSFNYGQFYSEIKLFNDLTVPREEQSWLLKAPKKPTPHEVVLYLGCNVIRTSHMVRTVCEIFKLLGVDFVAVGGGGFCCGSPYIREGDLEVARSVNQNTIDSFAQFQPEKVVMWCPSCIHTYDEVIQSNTPYATQHVTQFLVDYLPKLPFTNQGPQRIAMHYHVANQARRDEAESARTLLQALPGVEYIDIGSDPGFARHCTAEVQQNLGPGLWDEMVNEQLQSAIDSGADTFTTIYHGCQRLICPFQEQVSIPIEHYLSVFGRSLGIEYEDKFKKWKLWKNPTWVLQDMAPCMTANEVDSTRAQAMVGQNFPAS